MVPAAQEAADVIQDLLTLARRGRYDMKPTDLNKVVETYLDSPGYLKLSSEAPESYRGCESKQGNPANTWLIPTFG